MILYKLVNSSLCTPGHKYKLGPNIFVPENGEMFFTKAKYIFWYLNYGDILVTADVDEFEIIPDINMGDNLLEIPGMATRSCRVTNIDRLNRFNVSYLVNVWGADISADDYALFRYAWFYNKDLYEYLSNEYRNEFHEWITRYNGGIDPRQ